MTLALWQLWQVRHAIAPLFKWEIRRIWNNAKSRIASTRLLQMKFMYLDKQDQ